MALVGRGHRPPPKHLDDDGVADHPHAETRKGCQDDGYHSLQMQISVEQMREEHDEEELDRGVDPHVSPRHHACCGE